MSGGSIVDYASLQTAVANWLSRSDLTARIKDSIQLSESKMNRYLRTNDMVSKNATFSITGEYVAVPTDFGGVKTFYLNTSDRANLDFMPDLLQTSTFTSGTDQPEYYAVQGANFRFAPVPGSTYSATLVYYQKVPNLTDAATTNWMILNHPDAYLYGTLAEVQALAKKFDEAQAFETLFYRCMDEVKRQSNRDKYSGDAALVAKPG